MTNVARNVYGLSVDTEETDWAYLAGLVDGEGSIYIRDTYRNRAGELRQRRTPAVSIDVGMTDEATIERCRQITGVESGGRREMRNRIKPLYTWSAHSANAVWIAERLLPYSVTKREALERLIAARGGGSK